MKAYNSFLVRYWLARKPDAAEEEHAVIDVENLQTGERTRLTDPAEAGPLMACECRQTLRALTRADETGCVDGGESTA